jgi:hypothetical protein
MSAAVPRLLPRNIVPVPRRMVVMDSDPVSEEASHQHIRR